MGEPVPIREAIAGGYHPCINLDLLCKVYGCDTDELSVLIGEDRQNLIYYKNWNIAYEQKGGYGTCNAYYGNPFYDYFSSSVTDVQWTNQEPRWKQFEERSGFFTPEENILLLNAFTELMHWREDRYKAAMLKKLGDVVFGGGRYPADADKFQTFLRERERKLVLSGRW
jgi:hypothetical protein